MNRRSRARASKLARDLARARDLALDLARDLDLDLARDLDRDLARDLVDTLERALVRARELEYFAYAATQEETPGRRSSISERVSRGLVAVAVRVLPVRDRPRYEEEFRVELGELPRSEQGRYALRILLRAWELRRALTEAARTPDGEPVRRALEW